MFAVARLLLQVTRPHDTRLGDWPLMCPLHGQLGYALPAVAWHLLRAFTAEVAPACSCTTFVHGIMQEAQALCRDVSAAWRQEVFVSEGEDAPPADPLAPPRGPPPPGARERAGAPAAA